VKQLVENRHHDAEVAILSASQRIPASAPSHAKAKNPEGPPCVSNGQYGLPIQQLKDLEADHVLARTDYKEVPPRVDYALTPLGRSLADAIVPLCTWGTENMAEMASIFAKRDALP
jgi:hypothetical protein